MVLNPGIDVFTLVKSVNDKNTSWDVFTNASK